MLLLEMIFIFTNISFYPESSKSISKTTLQRLKYKFASKLSGCNPHPTTEILTALMVLYTYLANGN
jgi:hypothetical protein